MASLMEEGILSLFLLAVIAVTCMPLYKLPVYLLVICYQKL